MARSFDIVVFGATAYTGQYVVEHLANVYHSEGIKFAIAGRNQSKLEQVLVNVGKVLASPSNDLSDIPIIIADVTDQESLNDMCKQTKLLISIVGPYDWFGEPVVKAAVENGCHYLDISGEPQFLERMQLDYNKQAEERKVYVVGACGFDSIPSEMGIVYSRSQCETDISSIDMFMVFNATNGTVINSGTWKSAVNGVAKVNVLKNIRRALHPERLPKPEHPEGRKLVCKHPATGRWAVGFPGSDRSVAVTSNYFRMANSSRPVQFESYFTVGSIFELFGFMVFGIIFATFVRWEWSRKLMLKHPRLFSLGIFSDEGMTREQVEGVTFQEYFHCKVYPSKVAFGEKHTDKPDQTLVTRVSGPEPGYIACGRMITEAALVILKESDKLPGQGGVLTPGYAFEKTGLIPRLENQGIHFETLQGIEMREVTEE